MTEQTHIPRRVVLGAIGALAGATQVPTATAGEKPKCHGKHGRVCTLPCHETAQTYVGEHPLTQEAERTKKKEGSTEPEAWAPSALTAQNCGDCYQRLQLRVGEKLSTKQYLIPAEVDGLPSAAEITIRPGEKVTVWFTGQLHSFEAPGGGDMNVAISQRWETTTYTEC